VNRIKEIPFFTHLCDEGLAKLDTLFANFSRYVKKSDTQKTFSDDELPWAYFNESKEALNGLLTCVGIIVPEYIYGNIAEVKYRPLVEQEVFMHDMKYRGIISWDGESYDCSPLTRWLYENLGQFRLS